MRMDRRDHRLEAIVGLLYAWWRGDPQPALPTLPGFAVEALADAEHVAAITGMERAEVAQRLAASHWPYVANLDGVPAAFGWSASRSAAIGSAGLALRLPPGNRYLWDFLTIPAWRGRGIYPRLLQAIIAAERGAADRFWIGHDLENAASARGILKAGFRVVGELARRPDGGLALHGRDGPERARLAALLLGVPLVPEDAARGD